MNSAEQATSVRPLGLHCLQQPTNGLCVIFLHGILSDGETAWGVPSWPALLASDADLPGTGIYIFSYRTGLSSGTFGIGDASDNLREYFRLDDLWRQGKIVFVGHSMGGVVARKFILSQQSEFVSRGTEIRLFLVASPSLGADAANTLALLSKVLGQSQFGQLGFSQTNLWLNDLDRDFMTLRDGRHLHITGKELIEDKPVSFKRMLGLGVQVVPPFSAARYFGEALRVPESDHISIAKPGSRDTLQYRVLKRFVLDFQQPNGAAFLPAIEESETVRTSRAVSGISAKLPQIAQWHDAVAALQEALVETRAYVSAQSRGANRDADAEMRLSRIWSEVGQALFPHSKELAALCLLKGQGWADPRLWNDPRFSNLPVELDDMSQHLVNAMIDPDQLKRGLAAINSNLDCFEDVRAHEMGGVHPTSVVNRLTGDGAAVEFEGFGQIRKVTLDDLAKLNSEDREAIAASDTAMQNLMADWRGLISKGRLSESEEQERRKIEAQIAEHLELVLAIIEDALGGPLEDHYHAQRQIARQLKERLSARLQ